MNIQQGTVNFSQIFSEKQRLNVYYAIQQDFRHEPPATDGNSFPNEGDQRGGRRQLFSLNETWVISPTLVNEARLGGNRIHIVFNPDNLDNPAAFGINNGVSGSHRTSPDYGFGRLHVWRQQRFPPGRGDTTAVLSDTLSWIHGNHTIKLGGEERRANTNNFSATPGTFTFPSIAAFLADQATGFTTTTSNRSNRSYENALGLFVTDSWKVTRRLTLSLGLTLRLVFDTDGGGGPVRGIRSHHRHAAARRQRRRAQQGLQPEREEFRAATRFRVRSVREGQDGDSGRIRDYGRPARLWPGDRIGGKPAIRVSGFVYTQHRHSVRQFWNAYTLAGGSVAPTSVAHNYKNAYVSAMEPWSRAPAWPTTLRSRPGMSGAKVRI